MIWCDGTFTGRGSSAFFWQQHRRVSVFPGPGRVEIRLDFGWESLSSRGRALGGLPVKVGIKHSGRRLCGDSQEAGAASELGSRSLDWQIVSSNVLGLGVQDDSTEPQGVQSP